MKYSFLVLIWIILSILFRPQPVKAEDKGLSSWSKVYIDSKNKIPVIFSSGRICSGALVSKDQVLTAAHCIATLREIVLFWNQDYRHSVVATVLAMDRGLDLALLQLNENNLADPISIVDEHDYPKIGEEIVTIGHPSVGRIFEYPPFEKESTFLLSKGIVSQINERSLISDISVSPGNSGGPAINSNGKIVGVVSKKRIDRGVGNIAHIVTPQQVTAFLEKGRSADHPPAIFMAQSSLNLIVWNNKWLGIQNQEADFQSDFEWELSALLWDRLVIGTGNWFGGDVRRRAPLFYGWKYQFTTKDLVIWSLTPGISQWHHEGEPSKWGVSMILDHAYFPLAVKVTQSISGAGSESILSLGLRLF